MVFFTVVTHERAPLFECERARNCLHEAIAHVRDRFPFSLDAIVLLPDHLHAIWTLPSDDPNYSTRWRRIKEEFTRRYLKAGGLEGTRSTSRLIRGERAVWQRRFHDHVLRDGDDFERHLDYIHYNAVKHGYVSRPCDWPYSSFLRWVDRGVYPLNWACDAVVPDSIANLELE